MDTNTKPASDPQPVERNAATGTPVLEATDLSGARSRIDSADRALVRALRERLAAAREIGAAKHASGAALTDPEREQRVGERWASLAGEEELDPHAVGRVLREVVAWSRREQEVFWRQVEGGAPGSEPRVARVAYQGAPGAQGELAARALFATRGTRVKPVGVHAFDDCLAVLVRGEVEYALVPIENSIVGGIEPVNALLLEGRVHIVDEEHWDVHHALAALPGVELAEVERVASHPVALRQCRRTLVESMGLHTEEVWDSAGAADLIVEKGDRTLACVTSAEGAEARGLTVLREDVSDHPQNRTRFLLLAREPEPVPPGLPSRTTLRLITDHSAGSLAACLSALAEEGVNLTRIASLVLPRRPGQYGFLVDLEGGAESEPVERALLRLRRMARQLTVLGSYPDRSPERGGPELSLEAARDAAPSDVAVVPVAARRAELRVSSDLPLVSAIARADGRPHAGPGAQVDVAGVPVGGDRFVLIAGPCAVESATQIEAAADAVKRCGAALMRGGAFKPRTSTYSFQGLGLPGLDMLVEAGHRRGLPVVTEVMQARDVEAIAERADVLQVGARNMQNFELLRALGRVDRPVLLKRGMSATIEEWLHAAEYLLAGGNQRVVLCERGIRTFETATRATLDIAAIPVLRERTHLPVIVDPSHAAGRRELVIPLALAAAAAGADGLIVECHPNPDEARCDKAQALTPADLELLVQGLEPILAGQGRKLS